MGSGRSEGLRLKGLGEFGSRVGLGSGVGFERLGSEGLGLARKIGIRGVGVGGRVRVGGIGKL